MLVSVLASGSEGNSTFIQTKDKKILIDLGMNNKYITSKLEELGVKPEEIDDLLDKYNSKSTLQTEALTNSLKDRLLRIVDSNIQVNMEYSKYNLS